LHSGTTKYNSPSGSVWMISARLIALVNCQAAHCVMENRHTIMNLPGPMHHFRFDFLLKTFQDEAVSVQSHPFRLRPSAARENVIVTSLGHFMPNEWALCTYARKSYIQWPKLTKPYIVSTTFPHYFFGTHT